VPDFAVADADGTRRVAELARDGRPLLIDLTEGAVVAAAVTDIADRITVATGRPVGDMSAVSAKALLMRPDGYVAWASSAPKPGVDPLRRTLKQWFGVAAS
jgi:hypothetical protein